MNIIGMGPIEIILVIVLALLLFGPEKLPELASKIGKMYRNLTKATGELTKTINKEISLENELREKAKAEKSPAPSPAPGNPPAQPPAGVSPDIEAATTEAKTGGPAPDPGTPVVEPKEESVG